jgi:lipoprotein NlpD
MPGWRSMAVAAACVLLTAGCASTRYPAPVSDRTQTPPPQVTRPAPPAPAASTREADSRPEFYTVKRGDTLYLIALDYGLDYRELAEWNNIDNPNVIRSGQQLRLRPPLSSAVAIPLKPATAVQGKPVTAAAPAATPLPAPVAGAPANDAVKSQPKGVKLPYSEQALAQLSGAATKPPPVVAAKPEPRAEEKTVAADDDDEKIDWGWPTSGKLLSTFNEATNLKGVGIAGKAGQPVIASAPGKVLYSGDGIRGYGKLVIVKHNKEFLSVYAHNSVLSVKEGQTVVKGQKLAEMGNSDSDQVKLHFEIRRFGKPVDPVRLLPGDRSG